jgi:hypothetical protein
MGRHISRLAALGVSVSVAFSGMAVLPRVVAAASSITRVNYPSPTPRPQSASIRLSETRASSPNPAPSLSPDAVEITSLRTRDSKTFRNPDGTKTAVFAPDLHYESSPGVWSDVDLTLRREGSDYVADHQAVIVRVTNAGVLAIERGKGEGILWATPRAPSVSGRAARFSAQGLSWTYYATLGGLKLLSTVGTRRGPQTYSFTYRLVGDASPFTVPAASTGAAEETSSTLSYSTKITNQMGPRGWTTQLVEDTVSNPAQTHDVWDYTTGDKQSATAYESPNGGYVVVNDETGQVVQVSDVNNPNWKPVWDDPRFQR